MKQIYTKNWGILFLFSLFGSPLWGQFTVSGVVSDDNGPLVGVTVVETSTNVGTATDIDGSFSIKVPAKGGLLTISYLGYASQEIEVPPGTNQLTITLKEETSVLEQVVVTGLATNVKRSNAANSVASISSAELTGVVPPTTTDGALYGKFKGANITASSGAPGGGISMRLRGVTSINGSSEPLFIIDGIYLSNAAIPAGLNVVSAASSGGSASNQDNPSNRLADIDPNDIESVEILKGASAAAIYGSRAAGGVVVITTKKGKQGKTKVRLSQSLGWSQILHPLGQRQWTEQKVLDSRFKADIDAFRDAKNSGNIHDYEDLLYGNKGLLSTTRVSLTGGTEKTNFFIGATRLDNGGIVKNTGYKKNSFRVNIGTQLSDRFDLSTTANFINSSADRGFFNNDNSGTTMGVSYSATPNFAQLLPDADGNYPANPYAASNFLETGALVTNNESVNRFLGGATLTTKLLNKDNSNLKLITRAGIDYFTLATKAIFPNTLQFERVANSDNGVSVQGDGVNTNVNLSAFLVHSYYAENGMSFRTQVGVTQENFNLNIIQGTAKNLNGSQTNLNQAGSKDIYQYRKLQTDKGFFVQEELNFNDKLIATLGVRGDKSSNNGDVNKLYYYPKASLALNVHKMTTIDPLSQAKVRVAYGQSGNFARFGAKYTSFVGGVVGGNSALEPSNLLGNPGVSPERQKELEFGFDLGALDNKMLLDFTYYIKTVTDLLLNADVPTSSGFTSRVTNAADLENKGFEIGLNYQVLSKKDFGWDTRVAFWKNKSKVTRLDVPSFTTGGFADFLGNFRIKEGHSPTEIIGVGPNPDEDGLVVFGDAQPDFEMSFNNGIRYKNFDLSFLFHWKKGGKNINLSTLLFDLSETTHDFDDKGLDPEGNLTNGPYRLSQLGANTDPYVEDAGYLRMREIGLFYTIGRAKLNNVASLRVGFSGTNLINIFKYNSYDPEVSNFGGSGLSTGVEVLPFPSSKSYNFHVTATF
ncbi:MAG TPA: SusC/RagA family TonB-linked outer membrane protein [Saprospiraceae bacterium]|nr:SusC/RagA family TonB-linked outer membrane protein [Saprospiraceae bacterium]